MGCVTEACGNLGLWSAEFAFDDPGMATPQIAPGLAMTFLII
jgi:hypothetical protein